MAYWLVKTEPAVYSYADLEREGTDYWDGVRNNLAQKHMKAMQPGDLVLVYHTGSEKQAVGVAEVVRGAYPDPTDPTGRWVAVDLKARLRLPRPVTLVQIKADPAFKDWELVRNSRLSVMPVPEPLWERIMRMAGLGSV
ncbi:EVE domain-containing protein [Thermaerobacter composti]|uniref:EVE domain-containing protein n=1 Tax=Thermaerobacter composti TaxID=554949 RepID=A0ABZ0QQJ8_9FIRM|nr:EVE domain-containing protein [Thermaerobacter composti]WPD19769.1 EVE domain-containing protein [Thermaerobacter composti]